MDRYEALMNLAIKKRSVTATGINGKEYKTSTNTYETVMDDARSIHLFFKKRKKTTCL